MKITQRIAMKLKQQKIINKYIENGGDLSILTYEQKAKITQESINKYVENGGDISN